MASSVINSSSSDLTQISPRQTPVLICGGGISGLSLSIWLRQLGIESVVLDKAAAPGGVIGSLAKGGFLFERGPSSVLAKYPSFDQLIVLAGLGDSVIRLPLADQARYIWLRGKLRRVPQSALEFLRSPLLPVAAKFALLCEPFIKQGPAEESVADFVRRRLGPDWLRNLITPMISGIWAGNPEQLSIGQAFPIMKELEREGGLIRGGFKRQLRAASTSKARQKRQMTSFTGGLQRLPFALAELLGETYCPRTQIESITPLQAGGFTVQTRSSDSANIPVSIWQARYVIIAAEAYEAAHWVGDFDAKLASTLHSVPYTRLAVLSLGLTLANAHLPAGFGFLVPRGEGLRILGAIFHSNFLPGRAPAGCACLSVFMGGEIDPEILELSDGALLDVARLDLSRAVGWRGEPLTMHLERWNPAIPQYDMEHHRRLAAFASAESRWPGLLLAGNWRGGVAIAERVEAMRLLAGEIGGGF